MKYESSAGGIIITEKPHSYWVLLLKDKSGNWTFPKGLIEKGEERSSAANREIVEEVGIKKLHLLAPLTPIEYFYKSEGELIKKKVYYYIFTSDEKEKMIPQREEGILDVAWFGWAEAELAIGYKKTNLPLLKEAKAKLDTKKTHTSGGKNIRRDIPFTN